MATTRLQCQGCDKVFATQQGLVQHIAKTEQPLCRAVNAALLTPTILQFFSNTGHPLIFDMNPGHLFASDVNPASSNFPEEVQGSSYKITSADEGKVLQPRAGFFTNVYISDDVMNDTDHVNRISSVPDATDATDSQDADMFKILTNSVTVPGVAVPEDVLPAKLEEAAHPLPAPRIQAEKADGPTSELTITHFPHGSPSAPFPGAAQGSAVYQSSQAALDSSLWALFCSKLDWEIACWAKTHGPTLTAMTELLAIPGVRCPCLELINLLTHGRSSRDLVSHIRQQMS